jgi:hypothetical protein
VKPLKADEGLEEMASFYISVTKEMLRMCHIKKSGHIEEYNRIKIAG